jgi:hypothetical protein
MKNFVTYSVSAISQIFVITFFLFSNSAIAQSETESQSYGREIHFLELPPTILNFKFQNQNQFWITSETQWKDFWKTNSRIQGEAPKLNVRWSSQSLLGIFWASKDAVVRIPTYQGIEEWDEGMKKFIRVVFALNVPCFGIITDNSPVKFLLVDKNFADIDSISIRTEETKSVGCF